MGLNSDLSLWYDPCMYGCILCSFFMEIQVELLHSKDYTVSRIMHEGEWRIPIEFQSRYQHIMNEIFSIEISSDQEDCLIWEGRKNGHITVKATFEHYIVRLPEVGWKKSIWQSFISL